MNYRGWTIRRRCRSSPLSDDGRVATLTDREGVVPQCDGAARVRTDPVRVCSGHAAVSLRSRCSLRLRSQGRIPNLVGGIAMSRLPLDVHPAMKVAVRPRASLQFCSVKSSLDDERPSPPCRTSYRQSRSRRRVYGDAHVEGGPVAVRRASGGGESGTVAGATCPGHGGPASPEPRHGGQNEVIATSRQRI